MADHVKSRTSTKVAMSTASAPCSDEHRAGGAGPDAGIGVREEHHCAGRPAERGERGSRAEPAACVGRGEILLYPRLDTEISGIRERETRPRRGLQGGAVVRHRT